MVYNSELFNIDPYYDDFDESKNFLRFLFRPGYAIQGRELTQLQTLIQNQLERFGNHVFHDGSIVFGSQVSENNVYYARVNGLSGTTDISDLEGSVLGKTGNVSIRILHTDVSLTSSSVDVLPVIYFQYVSGSGLTNTHIISGTASSVAVSATICGLTGITGSAVGDCTVVNISDGIRYVDGFFVRHDAQNIALYNLTGSSGSEYRNFTNPTVRVGFDTTRTYITSDDDESLKDPAFGAYNYAAPGADRYKIALSIQQYDFTPTNTAATDNFSRTDFIEFLRVVDGTTIKKDQYPDYAVLEETLARRTYDESGNYTVRPFDLSMENNTETTLLAKLEAGKAYIFGHEFETQGATRVTVNKARTTRAVSEESLDRVVGSYLTARFGNTANNFGLTFNNDNYQNVLLSSSTGASAFVQVGSARLRHVNYASGNDYYVYLYDISFSGSNQTSNIRSIFKQGVTGAGTQLFEIPSGTTASIIKGNDNNLLFQLNYSGLTSVTDFDLYYWMHRTLTFGSTGNATLSIGSFYDQYVIDLSPGVFPQSSLMVFTQNGLALTGTVSITGAPEQLVLQLNSPGATFAYVYCEVQSNDVTDIRSKSKVSETVELTSGSDITFRLDDAGNYYLYLKDRYDVIEVSHITGNNGSGLTNMTNYFRVDTGQRDNYYDWGRIVAINGASANSYTGPYSVTLTKYVHSGFGPIIVNSYPNYKEIPSYYSQSTGELIYLRDVVDFRPYKDSSGSLTGCDIPSDNSLAQISYNHYLPRTDKIVLTRDRQFKVLQGTPSLDALPPADDSDSMTLYSIMLNPFTYTADDVNIRYVENKRYTMRDIGKLEKRIDNLEYYTSLSIMEQEAKNTPIYDEDGFDRPKLGILVDTFKGHNIGDVLDPYYACSIDYEKSQLRPRFKNIAEPAYILLNQSGLTTTQDEILMASWSTEEACVVQTIVTDSVNVNDTGVFNALGKLKMSPSTDAWYDDTNPALVKVNVNGENDNWIAPCASGNGFGTQWNDWELNWVGKEIIEEQISNKNKTSVSRSVDSYSSSSITNLSNKSVAESIRRTKLNRYVNDNIIPWIRSQNVSISAEGLNPNTRFYPYFDGVDVSSYCTGSLTSDSYGRISGLTFGIPARTFRCGQRLLRLTDSSTNTVENSRSSAENIFYAKGYLQSREDNIVSISPPVIRREAVNTETIINNIFTRKYTRDGTTLIGNLDPLAQSFSIDSNFYPDGVFVSKIGILFKSKETVTNEPVILQIRPMNSGYPHPSKIIPFSEVYLYPSSVSTSTDGSSITNFTFTTPVYLTPGDYAICLLSSSDSYEVYTAKAGSYSTVDTDQRASKGALNGALYRPQNSGAYSPTTTEDLCFVVYKCVFNTTNTYTNIQFDNTVFTSQYQTNVDVVRIVSEELVPTNTSITYESTGTDGLRNQEYAANKNILANNTSTRQITVGSCPDSNFKITYSASRDVTPQIDVNRLYTYMITNHINSNTTPADTAEGSATQISATSPTLSRYITKSVELDDTVNATNINVYLNAYKPIEATIQVWFRYLPYGTKTGISDSTWTQLSNTVSENSANETDYVELKYTLNNDIERFGIFQVKVVISSSDSLKSPVIRNMRAIVV